MLYSSKKQLRQKMRAARREMGDSKRSRAAKDAAKLLLGDKIFQQSRKIAIYLPNDGELDPSPLFAAIWSLNKQSFLPKILWQKRLQFVSYNPESRMIKNRYGIWEPAVAACNIVPAWSLDLVVLPLVAFDKEGHRLGMGGGYYDRTFSFLRHRRCWKKPHLIGLGYDFQKVDLVPHGAFDVSLSGVVTEKKLYRCK